MLTLIEKCFPEQSKSAEWMEKLRGWVPSYGSSLAKDVALLARVRGQANRVLELERGVVEPVAR